MKKNHELNLFFKTKKKSSCELLYPAKKWSLKTHFRSEKNWESVGSNFDKLVDFLAKHMPVRFFNEKLLVRVTFNALSGFFASKMSFWWSFFSWIDKFTWTFFWFWKTGWVRDLSSFLAISKSEVWVFERFSR